MIGDQDLLKEQAEKGAVRADGHRHLHVHRSGRCRAVEALRHPRDQDVRQRRDPNPSDRRAVSSALTKSQGQGHETTWAQIVAEELGLDPQTIMVEEGDTDTAPYGLGTYASRSTPVAGAAIAMPHDGARERRKIAAHLLEVGEADVEWKDYKFQVARRRRP